MEIKIVGPGCKNCQKLKENVETAVSGLGITPIITKVVKKLLIFDLE